MKVELSGFDRIARARSQCQQRRAWSHALDSETLAAFGDRDLSGYYLIPVLEDCFFFGTKGTSSTNFSSAY